MKAFKRFVAGLCFALLAASPALAQWQVGLNAIPLGKGGANQGFNVVAGSGGAGIKCLMDTNPPTFTTCPGAVSNLVVGTSTVTGGVPNALLFNNSGVLGATAWLTVDDTAKRIIIRKVPGTFPVPGAFTGLATFGPDSPGGEARHDLVAVNGDGVLACNAIDTSYATPTPRAARQQVCGWTGGTIHANGDTTFQQGGYHGGFVFNKWTVLDHSWYWDVGVIARGTTAQIKSARFSDLGGFAVNSADVFPPLGVIEAGVGYTVNMLAPSGNVLRGDGVKFVAAQLAIADLSGFGTGVATALGVNVGSPGSFTVNGGVGAFTTLTYSSTLTGTSTSANALAVGRNGATNPVLQIDASTASAVTGLVVKGGIATGGAQVSVTSSGANEALFFDAKGTGAINFGANSSGNVNALRPLVLGYGVGVAPAGQLQFLNATSGSITINPPAGALGSAVWTLQTGTDTFVGRASTDTLTNKTISGANNTLSNINTNTILTLSTGGICSPTPQNATSFFGLTGCWSAVENVWQAPVSIAMTAKNMRVVSTVTPAAGQTYIVTLRKNTADTTVTCTISNPATTCSDTSNSVAFAAGDLISMKVVASATAGPVNAINTTITGITVSP